MEPATLSPIVKRLEAQGRVTRHARAADERVLDIDLTPAGRALRDDASMFPRQVMARPEWMSPRSRACATRWCDSRAAEPSDGVSGPTRGLDCVAVR